MRLNFKSLLLDIFCHYTLLLLKARVKYQIQCAKKYKRLCFKITITADTDEDNMSTVWSFFHQGSVFLQGEVVFFIQSALNVNCCKLLPNMNEFGA